MDHGRLERAHVDHRHEIGIRGVWGHSIVKGSIDIHEGSGIDYLGASFGQSAGVHALDIPLHTPGACWECQVATPLGCFASLAGLAPRRRFGLCSLSHGENSENDKWENRGGGMFHQLVADSGIPHAGRMRLWRANQKSLGLRVSGGVSGVPPSIETVEVVECHWNGI